MTAQAEDPQVADTQAEDTTKIGLLACLAFAVGTMVGGGVFHLSGTAINKAGPGAIVAYLLAGVLMLLSALSFVAVAGRAREGESGYEPLNGLLSNSWRFFVMWGFVINGLLMIPFLVDSFGEYFNQYLYDGIDPLAAAVLAIAVLTLLNLGSAELVGRAETYVVAVKITLLGGFIVVGLWNVGDAKFTPFLPEGSGGISEVTALLFTAYTGFNVVTNMAGSVRDPERTVPRAVIGSVLITIVVYVGVVVAMLASGLGRFGSAGLGDAAEAMLGSTGAEVIAIAACLSTLSGANAFLIATSEVVHSLAHRDELPTPLARTTAKGHPLASVGVIATFAALLVGFGADDLVAVANVAALGAMIVVNLAAIRLARAGWPGKGLRIPGGPVLPAIAAVTCALQFRELGWGRVAIGAALLALGAAVYHRPRLARQPRAA